MAEVMRVDTISHLLSVVNYAKAAGVLTRTIHERFRKGVMKPVVLDGRKFIDVRTCPPGWFRKRYPTPAVRPIALPDGTLVANLRWVNNYARLVHHNPVSVYKHIVQGKLDCMMADDVMFIDISRFPPEKFGKFNL